VFYFIYSLILFVISFGMQQSTFELLQTLCREVTEP